MGHKLLVIGMIESNAHESGYKCFWSDKFYVVPQRHCFNGLHVMTFW